MVGLTLSQSKLRRARCLEKGHTKIAIARQESEKRVRQEILQA